MITVLSVIDTGDHRHSAMRWISVASAFIAYTMLFFWLKEYLGVVALVFSLLPVAVVALFWGWRGALLVTPIVTLFNLALIDPYTASEIPPSQTRALILFMNLSFGLVLGFIRNTGLRLWRMIWKVERSLTELVIQSGLVPICSYCHQIRDGRNFWHTVENPDIEPAKEELTNGICPACYSERINTGLV